MEHSAILLTFIKLPFVIKIFVLSIFEWKLKTGFTVLCDSKHLLTNTLVEIETVLTSVLDEQKYSA